MKKLYFSLSFCLLAFIGFSQNYFLVEAIDVGINPGNLNNDPEQPEAFLNGEGLGYSNVLSSTATDVWSSAQSIPFSFQFNGSAVSSYIVSASGVVSFSTSASATPGSTPAALPSALIPDNSICAWGLDLSGGNDAVVSKTFGTAPNRQHWVIWASASNSDLGAGSWAYWGIVMEETSNAIYVVDMRSYSPNNTNSAMTVGIQVNSSTALQVAGSPNVQSYNTATGGNQSDALDNTFYGFYPGTQPQYDLQLVGVEAPSITGVTTQNALPAIVFNKGSATITSFDYSFDDGAGNNGSTAINANLATGSVASVQLNPGWVAGSTGNFNVDLSIENPNGNTDANPSDNSQSVTIQAANSVPRVMLAEKYTSSTCPPCATWNTNVYNAALANYNLPGEPILVNYQVPIPTAGDPSHNPDSDARRADYGINSAPSMVVNGQLIEYNVATWADAVAAYAAAEQAGKDEPAFVSVSGNATYEAIGGNQAVVDVTANVTSGLDLSSGNYALQIVVAQLNYTYAAASNGDTDYKHVMRKMLPSPSGTPLSLSAGGSTTVNESYTFNIGNVQGGASGNFNLWNNNVEVIVFVEDRDNNRTMNASMAFLNYIGLDEQTVVKANVYPNPTRDILNIELETAQVLDVELVDLSGKSVFQASYGETFGETISTSNLNAGMYILKITADGNTATQRISVVR